MVSPTRCKLVLRHSSEQATYVIVFALIMVTSQGQLVRYTHTMFTTGGTA